MAILLALSVIFSLIVLLIYVNRDGELYEELTDYLDKTVSISKINYNPSLGNYEIRQDEFDILADQRRVGYWGLSSITKTHDIHYRSWLSELHVSILREEFLFPFS